MLEAILVQTATALFQWAVFSWWDLFKVLWAWGWAHPANGILAAFSVFAVSFAAYGTLRRMWEDGSFAAFNFAQKLTVMLPAVPWMIMGYGFDIGVMRVVYGWITFRVPPWKQDFRFWSASWTFSRLVALYKNTPAAGGLALFDRGRHARFWAPILHAIDPYGH